MTASPITAGILLGRPLMGIGRVDWAVSLAPEADGNR
jgi:hypothetical protein